MVLDMYKKMVMSLMPENIKAQVAKEKGTLSDGLKYVLLTSLVVIIVEVLGILLDTFLGMGQALGGVGQQSAIALGAIGGLGALGIVVTIIMIPIVQIISAFIMNGIVYILAKLLGGKGTFENQFYHIAILSGGLSVITGILGLVPCVGPLLSFILVVYYLYPLYLLYMGVHKLSSGRAIALILIPFLVIIVLAVIVAVLFAGMMTAMLGTMAGAGALNQVA